jgi:nucleotide-binding universal stress UspA family protein
MKVKPSAKNHGVVVELGPEEAQMPAANVFSLKRILVPLDFSDCSKKALQYAIPFAKQFEAELTLLSVVEPYPAVPEMAPTDFETIADTRRGLEELRETVTNAVQAKTMVRTGAPETEIAYAAADIGADLIIIATHGRKGLTRMVLGSTAEKVVRHAPCPVLIVREKEREFIAA